MAKAGGGGGGRRGGGARRRRGRAPQGQRTALRGGRFRAALNAIRGR